MDKRQEGATALRAQAGPMTAKTEPLGLVRAVIRPIDALNNWVGRASSWLAYLT